MQQQYSSSNIGCTPAGGTVVAEAAAVATVKAVVTTTATVTVTTALTVTVVVEVRVAVTATVVLAIVVEVVVIMIGKNINRVIFCNTSYVWVIYFFVLCNETAFA